MAGGNILEKSCGIYETLKVYENLKIDFLVIVKNSGKVNGWVDG